MLDYKRNQIEEAISGVLEPRAKEPSVELRNQLKRLIDTDRNAGRSPSSKDPERSNYAFFGGDSPGSGKEVRFSEYEGFAILNGLTLLRHGWPQGRVVSMMRQTRPAVEAVHRHIVTVDSRSLFDETKIRQMARAGDMAFDVTNPVLLVIVSKSGAESQAFKVCQGVEAAYAYLREETKGGGAGTLIELASLAHQFSQRLIQTIPTRRGPK